MNPVLLQKQVRDNAEDVNSYMRDLKCWETDMKRKENELGAQERGTFGKKDSSLPPVRNKIKKSAHKIRKSIEPEVDKSKNKIPGNDYASWDRFDVDKACAEVDADSEESDEETESDEEVVGEQLREEAIYEKEKGNQFVKNKRWSEAIVCYSRAIECFPYDAIYYANRALCYLKNNDFHSAETDCTSSLQLDISYVKAYQRRAAARVGLGLLLEAKSDLETVLRLEPMNTGSKVELIKVEKLINTSTSAKLVSKVVATDQTVVSTKLVKPDRGAGESWEAKMSWGTDAGVKLVQPINKPPHLRSKKPLKRIEIQEIGGLQDIGSTPEARQSTSFASTVESSSQYSVGCPPADDSDACSVVVKEEKMDKVIKGKVEEIEEMPSRPNSSVEFLVGWKKVKSNRNLTFSYLKQIPGDAIPKIFQESLESATLSDLISTLVSEFLQNNEPVYEYLVGISNVKRLSALTLFMSNADKEGVKKLLSSCIKTQQCTEEEANKLKTKFEL